MKKRLDCRRFTITFHDETTGPVVATRDVRDCDIDRNVVMIPKTDT